MPAIIIIIYIILYSSQSMVSLIPISEIPSTQGDLISKMCHKTVKKIPKIDSS